MGLSPININSSADPYEHFILVEGLIRCSQGDAYVELQISNLIK